MCSLSNPAAITIMNKAVLENVKDVIVNQVMNNAVAKIGCKDLSFNGLVNNKADAWARGIASIKNFITQPEQFPFIVHLKG